MQLIVYRLRERGQRLELAQILARHAPVGQLVFAKRPVVPEHQARLLGETGSSMLVDLDCATVERIGSECLLIRGFESSQRTGSSSMQTWLCSRTAEAALAALQKIVPSRTTVADAPQASVP